MLFITKSTRTALRLCVVLIATLLLGAAAPGAGAMTITAPTNGQHFKWTELRPTVTFTPVKGETPKWILVSLDANMSQPVRYCRAFAYSSEIDPLAILGTLPPVQCNEWAVGVDSYGRDVYRALVWNKTYYTQVIYTDVDGKEQKSEVRGFTIDAEPAGNSASETVDRIYQTTVGDGVNKGAAAFVNSGVKVTKIGSTKIGTRTFQIRATHNGDVTAARSYITVKSKAGTRYIKVRQVSPGVVEGIWKQTSKERKQSRFEYQAVLKSVKNGAMVKSQRRVVVIKAGSKAVKPSVIKVS